LAEESRNLTSAVIATTGRQPVMPVKRLRKVKIPVRLSLAMFITFTAIACGGPNKMKEAAQSVPATTAAPHTSVTASPATDEKIVYHDAAAGNDVTVKTFRTVIGQMPKQLTCDEILTAGKALGNTYPNGEDFFLQRCKEVPRHSLLR
jgi:hypothetical protein